MKLFSYILFIALINSCVPKSNPFTLQEVVDFHKNYGNDIVSLCDSIQNKIQIDSSFCVEFRPKNQEVYFFKYDSSGNLGYFESNFTGEILQKELLTKTVIHEICFNQANKIFRMKTFLLKKFDKALQIEVLPLDVTSKQQDTATVIFRSERCVYKVVNAW